jgi:alpha-1,2-mannosyltransferase
VAGASALVAAVYLSVWGGRYGLDLKVYRNSVTLWRSGHDAYLATLAGSRLPFTYPPFALLALSPLTWASFPVTQWLLWAASIVSATVSVVLVLRDRGFDVNHHLWCGAFSWACISIIILEPARSDIDYGQIGLVLMFIVVADLLAIPSPYRGIATGIVAAVKLTPLVFVMAFLVRRDVKSASRALASFAACSVFSWLLWPGLPRVYWDHVITHPARVGRITYGGNQSWYAILHRPSFPAAGSTAAWLLLSLATLAVSGLVAWRSARANQQASAMISIALAGLLISPVSWTHHWVWVLLIPPMIVGHREPEAPRAVQIGLWGVIALTVAVPYWWFSSGIPADVCDALLPVLTAGSLAVWAAAPAGDGSSRPPWPPRSGTALRRWRPPRAAGRRAARGTGPARRRRT